MDISNRALAVLLLATMVVSLGGTIVSLNRLGSLSTTGFTPAVGVGTVNLTINESISITTEDSSFINFGLCIPFPGMATVVNSEEGENTSTRCPEYVPSVNPEDPGDYGHGYIAVRNNGNVDVNVTIVSDDVGAAQGGGFLNSSSGTSTLEFRIDNDGHDSYGGGCDGNIPAGREVYTPFNLTDPEVLVCGNLTTDSTDNSFLTYIQITLPYDATGSAEAELTFWAESLS